MHQLVGHPMLDKKIYPGPPGWGFGHKANKPTLHKYLIAEKPNNGCQLDNSGERPRKSYEDNDFYSATWNVIRLYRVGMLKENWTNTELILQQSKW